jgi:hypothetical protein
VGAVFAQSSDESAKYQATLAAIHGQFTHRGDGNLLAVSAASVEWMEAKTIVFSLGYNGAVGSFLHDTSVSSGLWTSDFPLVAGDRPCFCMRSERRSLSTNDGRSLLQMKRTGRAIATEKQDERPVQRATGDSVDKYQNLYLEWRSQQYSTVQKLPQGRDQKNHRADQHIEHLAQQFGQSLVATAVHIHITSAIFETT